MGYATADLLERASEYLAQFSYSRALAQAEIALANLEEGPEDVSLRAQAHEIAGQAALAMGEYPMAEEYFRHAAEILHEQGEAQRLLECELGLAECSFRQGNLLRARHICTNCLLKATGEHWHTLSAKGLACLGNIARGEGDISAAADYLQRAVELFQQEKRDPEANRARVSLGVAYALSSRNDEARQAFEEALAYFRTSGDAAQEVRALHNLAGLEFKRHDVAAAREHLLQCVDLENEIHNRGDLVLSWFNLGLIETRAGELKLAKKYFHRSFQLAQEVGDRTSEGLALLQLGAVALLENKPQEALNYAELSADNFAGSPSAMGRMALNYMPVFHLANNQVKTAQECWDCRPRVDNPEDLLSVIEMLDHLASDNYAPALKMTKKALQLARAWRAEYAKQLEEEVADPEAP